MSEYKHKMMTAETTRNRGCTVIILDDVAKRGGDELVNEYVRNGERKKEDEKAAILKLLRGADGSN